MKKHDLLQTWAVKHNDIQVRMSSRSGGIFTALSDRILEQNGVVYGASADGVVSRLSDWRTVISGSS